MPVKFLGYERPIKKSAGGGEHHATFNSALHSTDGNLLKIDFIGLLCGVLHHFFRSSMFFAEITGSSFEGFRGCLFFRRDGYACG